jgi:hypothetical protein
MDEEKAVSECAATFHGHRCNEEVPHEKHIAENAAEGGADLVWTDKDTSLRVAAQALVRQMRYAQGAWSHARFEREVEALEDALAAATVDIDIPLSEELRRAVTDLILSRDAAAAIAVRPEVLDAFNDDVRAILDTLDAAKKNEPSRTVKALEILRGFRSAYTKHFHPSTGPQPGTTSGGVESKTAEGITSWECDFRKLLPFLHAADELLSSDPEAQVVAATPDLLEALEVMIMVHSRNSTGWNCQCTACDKARAAVKQARGGDQ